MEGTGEMKMTKLFDDLQEGLNQAIDFAEGKCDVKVVTYKIEPVVEYSSDQIRKIRMEAMMTQRVFADILGVSVKTVEAWERGRTHPTGPACRLIKFIEEDEKLPFVTKVIS